MWELTLPATKADNQLSYTITVTSDKYGSATITDVKFGDVWMCGGESNMQFSLSQVRKALDWCPE